MAHNLLLGLCRARLDKKTLFNNPGIFSSIPSTIGFTLNSTMLFMSASNLVNTSIVDLDFLNFDNTHPILIVILFLWCWDKTD